MKGIIKGWKMMAALIGGGIIGFGLVSAVYAGMNKDLFKLFDTSLPVIIYMLLSVVISLLVIAVIIMQKTFKLHKQTFAGEEEDRVEELKYRKAADYTLLTTSAMYLSFLPVSISYIYYLGKQEVMIFIISVIVLMIAAIGNATVLILMQKLDPHRMYPRAMDPDSHKKIVDMMDEGEMYVTFQGLYKAFNRFNGLLVLSIVLAMVYSILANQSQMFSIVLLVIVLLVGNASYLLTIRKKY